MVQLRAFQGYRANSEVVDYITNYPEKMEDTEKLKELVRDNQCSFTRIQRPSVDLEEAEEYDEKTYQKGKDNVKEFIQKEWLVKEQAPVVYVYA